MLRRVALILTLLMTPAAADDYRGYREAYGGVNWPNTITSAEQCQQRVADVVRQFGFTDAEFKPLSAVHHLNAPCLNLMEIIFADYRFAPRNVLGPHAGKFCDLFNGLRACHSRLNKFVNVNCMFDRLAYARGRPPTSSFFPQR